MKRMHVGVLLTLLILAACAGDEGVLVETSPPRLGDSTFEKFLVRAEADDRDAQNLIGFMLFFGEGVPMDRVEAHYWFHRAADQGHAVAQFNLAIMHAIGQDAVADPVEAVAYYSQAKSLSVGERKVIAGDDLPGRFKKELLALRSGKAAGFPRGQARYEEFCAGCHGLNGVARYVVSPSFAIGERMDKTDQELLGSIADGRGIMPSWNEKLGEEERREILAYVRTLQDRFQTGIALSLRDTPARYFIFGPMQNRPFASGGDSPRLVQQPAE